MGWGDSVESRHAAARGTAPPVLLQPPPQGGSRGARQKRRSGASPLLLAAAAAAVLLPVAQHLGWLSALERTLRRAGVPLPWRSRGGSDDEEEEAGGGRGGTRSAFRFPKGKAADPASSLPRNKQSNNKKNKSRKAEIREQRAQQREEKAAGVYTGKAGGVGTLPEPSRGNNVPKDEDILGGEAGKTFTTTTRYQTSAMYARIREERGD